MTLGKAESGLSGSVDSIVESADQGNSCSRTGFLMYMLVRGPRSDRHPQGHPRWTSVTGQDKFTDSFYRQFTGFTDMY